MKHVCAAFVAAMALVQAGRALRLSAGAGLESYSFAQFASDFGRSYAEGTAERAQRAQIFEASLAAVRTKNARLQKEGRSWTVGIHPFMDWTADERKRLNGYKPSKARVQAPAMLQTRFRFGAQMNATISELSSGGLTAEQGPRIRNQGNCGSCWAISGVEAVESYLQAQGHDVQLSAQALVDCVQNPKHCGGSGGCDGATTELAYQLMLDHGIPVEQDYEYTAKTGTCPQKLRGHDGWVSTGGAKRARLQGFSSLPSNKAEPLVQAILQGPVVVAVDGNDWFDYDAGVFDGCQKDATLGHAVLAKGFGEDSGKKYWLIQNSWGQQWGEEGHIRLLKTDKDDAFCGTDSKPQEGVGCDGGPPEVKVCGMCGLLYDPVVPQGVRLEDASSGPTAEEMAAASVTPWTPNTAASADSGASLKEEQLETSVARDNDSVAEMKKLLHISLLHTAAH